MDLNASTDFHASTVFYDSDAEDEKESLYFDASPTSNPNVKKKRPDMGSRTDSSGALEALMSEPKSPGKMGARRTRESTRRNLQDTSSGWDKLKKRMKSPGRLASPRRVSSPTRMQHLEAPDLDAGESLVAKSDHVLYDGRRASEGMAAAARARAALRSNTSHGGGARTDAMMDEIASESPKNRRRVRKKKESIDSDDSSVVSGTRSVKSAGPSTPKSPRARVKKVKNTVDDSPSVSSETPRQRLRRKGAKKANEFSTPNPRSKPMVELDDLARLTDVHGALAKSKKKSERRSSAESTDIKSMKSQKSSDGDVSLTPSEALLPDTLPFDDDDDDDGAAIMGIAKSKKKKKKAGEQRVSKSPGRAKRSTKVDVAGFEDDIAALQEEVLRLKESKISADSETSKHMQELRRKAFDARLELQKAQLENRQVRSDLRDKTTALNDAESDIEALEKKLKEKDAEMEQLRARLKEQSINGEATNGSNRSSTDELEAPPPPPAATPTSKRAQQAIIDRYEAIINRKDTKLANLERELRRLRKSGGGVLQSEENEMQETIADLQKALKESQGKTLAISKKFSDQRDQFAILEEEIQHWKSQAFSMEDEIAEVRTQLNYWMAKYEDIVGASDKAKANLAGTEASKRRTMNSSYHSNDSSADVHIDDKAEDRSVGGLWSKLTTPGREKPKLIADSLAMRQSQYR